MNDFIKIPKRLAVAALVIMTVLVLSIIVLYFSATSAVIQNFLAHQGGSVTASTASLKGVLLPLIVMMLFPWALNLLGILYLKRYPVVSAVMFIVAGLMLLFTLIFPVLLITAGTMLVIRHRHYIQHEKYKTHYE
ncbi:hypothetical protein ERX35_006245 [Macrococcus equipercicus]|uniref:DUF4064 domain-containing protein n=1 Tax=Macrococcus equipercicus TaxID=69967 RepID=A0ABQ6R929_9STAP|nr:DUF4064 domain-containing protein [Macrococcus equipercicus]KAA1039671.1 hypothetical protein ERX35_006245 [Macrococcus equipercicus]